MQSLLPTTCLLQDLAAAVYPNPMLSVKYPEDTVQPNTNAKPYSNDNSSKCAIQFLLNSQMELSPVQPFTDANKNTRSISKQVSRRITKGTVAVSAILLLILAPSISLQFWQTFDNAFTIAHFHVPIKVRVLHDNKTRRNLS